MLCFEALTIFKFHTDFFSWNHLLVWIFVFQCLNDCHLIYRYRMVALFMNGFRLIINITDFIHFFCKDLWEIHFLGRVKLIEYPNSQKIPPMPLFITFPFKTSNIFRYLFSSFTIEYLYVTMIFINFNIYQFIIHLC